MTPLTVALWVYTVVLVGTVLAVSFVDAPYGRHDRQGWGPRMGVRAGWWLMESPSVVIPAMALLVLPLGAVAQSLLAIWLLHYGYRGVIYPALTRSSGRTMPLLVPLLGFSFNVLNAGTNVAWIVAAFGTSEGPWPGLFGVGLAVYAVGFVAHVRSDAILRGLRSEGGGYRIPHGFLFRWVSCPNYLGEMVQWWGWALLSASPAGVLFALYTMANLGPRALAHHRWYRETFDDYPAQRRALLPGLL